MPPLRDGIQAIEFFERWFQTDAELRPSRGRKYRIVARNADLSTTSNLIGITDQEWIGNFATSDDGLDGLVATFGGNVSVYPWYVVLGPGQTSVGGFDQRTEPDKKKACPGVWVDLRGSFHTAQIREFAEYLMLHDVPAPTVVTGRDMDGMLNYFDTGRMWWRTEWDSPPTLNNDLRAIHAAWGVHIQNHAIQSGLCTGLPVNGYPTLSEALYPMPGTDGVSVVYSGEGAVPWRTIEIATDRRLWDMNKLRDQFAILDALNSSHPEILWDHVLVPQGWHARGMGTNAHDQWWTAPGGKEQMTAMTTNKVLRLYLPDWLSGLKEASDAGVVLNKWTVACLLGWDGDTEALVKHWRATGKLY